MADSDDTGPAPPAAPAGGRPTTETFDSLADLRALEEKRLAEEAAAEQARREAAERERAEAERREREAAAERDRKAKADAAERQRAEAATAERARLLDVDRRLVEQEQALRAEFEGERARLAEELRAVRAAFRRIAVPAAIVGITAVVFTIVLQTRLGRAEREHVRVLATIERLERTVREINDQHTATTQQTAVLDRDLTDARERASRAEARVLELERAPTRPRPIRVATKPARPSAPKLIDTNVSDDPLGPLADDPPDKRRRP